MPTFAYEVVVDMPAEPAVISSVATDADLPVAQSSEQSDWIFIPTGSYLNTTQTSTAFTGWYAIDQARGRLIRSSDMLWSTSTSTVICGSTRSTWAWTSAVAYSEAHGTLQYYKPYIRPHPDKSIKNSIKRALKLMSNVGFEEEARIFLKGDVIEVSHPDSLLKFVLEKNSSIIDRTRRPGFSTPYALSLYTKSDVFVSRLCVYMPDTPVLDQVLAVAMFIKSGSEEMILKKANWFSLTRDEELLDILALEYPELSSKLLR